MKISSRRILVSLFASAMSLVGTVQPSYSAEEPAKAPAETPPQRPFFNPYLGIGTPPANAPAQRAGGFSTRTGKAGFELPEGVESILAFTPMPKPRVLPTGPVEGGTVTEGFQLTIRPEKYQVEVLEPIILHITIKNTTDKELGLIPSGRPEVNVEHTEKVTIPLTRHEKWIRDFMASGFGPWVVHAEDTFKGGEEKLYELLVNQTFDMTLSGSYFITASSTIRKPEGAAILSSNTVQIDVFPRGLLPKPTNDGTTSDQSIPEIRWGQQDISGLQIGTWKSSFAPTIFCVIKNQGQQTVHFNDYFTGYFEGISVLARPKGDTNWTKLRLRDSLIRGLKSVGPTESNSVTLLPGESYQPDSKKFPDPNSPPALSSFLISLYDYDLPATWKGVLEIKIEQRLPNFGNKSLWEGTLASNIMEVDVVPLKELLDARPSFRTKPHNAPRDFSSR